jgi:hypothetical protein
MMARAAIMPAPETGNEVYTKFPIIAPRIADLLGMDIQRFRRLLE